MVVLSGSGRAVSASGQVPAVQQTTPAVPPLAAPPVPTGPVVQLTADEAVRMALENNLGIQAERLAPQINTFQVAQAQAAYAPVLFSTFQSRSSTQPPNSFITGGSLLTTRATPRTPATAEHRWGGGRYSFSSTAARSRPAPSTAGTPAALEQPERHYTQPLLRNFKTDNPPADRDQPDNQVIADIGLREQ